MGDHAQLTYASSMAFPCSFFTPLGFLQLTTHS
jgi:hypothetical protein